MKLIINNEDLARFCELEENETLSSETQYVLHFLAVLYEEAALGKVSVANADEWTENAVADLRRAIIRQDDEDRIDNLEAFYDREDLSVYLMLNGRIGRIWIPYFFGFVPKGEQYAQVESLCGSKFARRVEYYSDDPKVIRFND